MKKNGKLRLKILILTPETANSNFDNPYSILTALSGADNAPFKALETSALPFDFEPSLCHQDSEAAMKLLEANKYGDQFAVAFIDQPTVADIYRSVEKFRARDPHLEIAVISDDPTEAASLTAGILPAEKVLLLKQPISAMEIRQAALVLGVKWFYERRLRNNEQIVMDLLTKIDALEKENKKRRMIETGIQKSRELFYTFLRNMPAIAFIKDCKGRYVYINEACLKPLNKKPVDFIGKTDKELWQKELAEQIMQADRQVLYNQDVFITDEHFEVNGIHQYFHTTRFPIIKNGKVFFIAGISFHVNIDTEHTKDKSSESAVSATAVGDKQTGDKNQLGCIPDSLPGLNIKVALERLGGALSLYIDLVAFLCKDKHGTSHEIREMVRQGKLHAAMMKAHALKGSAATIAAEDLTTVAKNIETVCREKKEDEIEALLEQLDQKLAQVFESSTVLIRMFPNLVPQEKSQSVCAFNTVLLDLISCLETSLDQCDPLNAEKHLKEIIAAAAQSKIFPHELDNIRSRIKEYDFDLARKLLDNVKQSIEQF